jgi:glucose-6-phosphate isomerase
MISEPIRVDFSTGKLTGEGVEDICRTIGDLEGVFRDEEAWRAMNPAQLVYRVQMFRPVEEGAVGGLFWGATLIEPGVVGDEYFMTKGHFHALRDRSEYYVTTAGQGALILMDESRQTRVELMRPGSVHYIPSHHAHRVANTGSDTLSFVACWPSDAGHDYRSILEHGFSARIRSVNGVPLLVEEP